MEKVSIEQLENVSKCYDKMSKKHISWAIAKRRLKIGLKNTFWVIIDSARLRW